MKTISMQTNSVGIMIKPAGLVLDWLPAPPSTQRSHATRPRNGTVRPANIWLALPHEPALEKAFLAGLAVAATIGIAYGFMCLINLVENWAAVTAFVGRMVQ